MNDLFAQALAKTDAETQAKFFNEFYRHLKLCCKGKDDTQICYVADYLDENGRRFAEQLHDFSKLAQESRAKHEVRIDELYRTKHDLEKEIAELRATTPNEVSEF
jgi:hypothetical protein